MTLFHWCFMNISPLPCNHFHLGDPRGGGWVILPRFTGAKKMAFKWVKNAGRAYKRCGGRELRRHETQRHKDTGDQEIRTGHDDAWTRIRQGQRELGDLHPHTGKAGAISHRWNT